METKKPRVDLRSSAFQFVVENGLARKVLVALDDASLHAKKMQVEKLRSILGNPDEKQLRLALMGLEQHLVIVKYGRSPEDGMFAVTPHEITDLGVEVVEMLRRAASGVLQSDIPEESKRRAASVLFPQSDD